MSRATPQSLISTPRKSKFIPVGASAELDAGTSKASPQLAPKLVLRIAAGGSTPSQFLFPDLFHHPRNRNPRLFMLTRTDCPKLLGFFVCNGVAVGLDQGPNVMTSVFGGAVGGAKHLIMVRAKGFPQGVLKPGTPRPQAGGRFGRFQQIINPVGVFPG
jgi:hypothetical protein